MNRLRRVIADVESIVTSQLDSETSHAARDLALERKLLRAATRQRSNTATPLAKMFGAIPQLVRSESSTRSMRPMSRTSTAVVLKSLVGRG